MTDVLKDRVALVTGGGGTLGASIARRFWSEGATLVLTGRHPEALDRVRGCLTERPGQACHVVADDLSDPAAAGRIVERTLALAGRLDVLVNNAAEQGPIGPAWETDWVLWQRTLAVDLVAAVALCRSAVPFMRRDGGAARAKIICMSGGGATGPRPNFSAYAVAKAGLVRFSETLARELVDAGIDVNCVAPGAMHSAMTEAVLQAGPATAGLDEYEAAGRTAQREDAGTERAADLCCFLASSASDGVTGRLVSAVWDPWETLAEHRDDLTGSDIYTLRRIVPADRGLNWGNR